MKRNSSNHPAVMTLRPAAADGIGTVMQGFKSQLTWAASGRFLAASGVVRAPDGVQMAREGF